MGCFGNDWQLLLFRYQSVTFTTRSLDGGIVWDGREGGGAQGCGVWWWSLTWRWEQHCAQNTTCLVVCTFFTLQQQLSVCMQTFTSCLLFHQPSTRKTHCCRVHLFVARSTASCIHNLQTTTKLGGRSLRVAFTVFDAFPFYFLATSCTVTCHFGLWLVFWL